MTELTLASGLIAELTPSALLNTSLLHIID